MIVAAIILVVGPVGFVAGGWFIRAIEDGRLSSMLARAGAWMKPRPILGLKQLKLASLH